MVVTTGGVSGSVFWMVLVSDETDPGVRLGCVPVDSDGDLVRWYRNVVCGCVFILGGEMTVVVAVCVAVYSDGSVVGVVGLASRASYRDATWGTVVYVSGSDSDYTSCPDTDLGLASRSWVYG